MRQRAESLRSCLSENFAARAHSNASRVPLEDQLAFAKELADPERIEHAEANILHAARGVGAVTSLRRKRARKEV